MAVDSAPLDLDHVFHALQALTLEQTKILFSYISGSSLTIPLIKGENVGKAQVIAHWLETDTDASWKKLFSALKQMNRQSNSHYYIPPQVYVPASCASNTCADSRVNDFPNMPEPLQSSDSMVHDSNKFVQSVPPKLLQSYADSLCPDSAVQNPHFQPLSQRMPPELIQSNGDNSHSDTMVHGSNKFVRKMPPEPLQTNGDNSHSDTMVHGSNTFVQKMPPAEPLQKNGDNSHSDSMVHGSNKFVQKMPPEPLQTNGDYSHYDSMVHRSNKFVQKMPPEPLQTNGDHSHSDSMVHGSSKFQFNGNSTQYIPRKPLLSAALDQTTGRGAEKVASTKPVSGLAVCSPYPATLSSKVVATKETIELLEDSYRELISDTRVYLCKMENQDPRFLNEVRDFLIPSLSHDVKCAKLFEECEDDILGAKTIRKLIAILSRYCNYRNCNIMFALIKQFCNAALQKKMAEYYTSLEQFEMTTTVDTYLAAISASDFARKMNKCILKCTLHDIRNKGALTGNASHVSHLMSLDNNML